MPSTATGVYQQIDEDVAALLNLHTGSGEPGRPVGNNGPLLRSAIVLLFTAWENYVEQAVTQVSVWTWRRPCRGTGEKEELQRLRALVGDSPA